MANSKALLNSYCQERHLQLPSYSTQREGSVGYGSSVSVCDRSFDSQARHSSARLAEEDAARVAYNSLRRQSESSINSHSTGYGYENSASVKRTAPDHATAAAAQSRNANTADYSQKLEKLCNARALPPPAYDVNESDGKFVATVTVHGNGQYYSGDFKSYDQAKDYASLIALAEVGLSLLNINEREDGKNVY